MTHTDARRRIAITGIGSTNALGAGVGAFLAGLRQGRCAIGELSLFPSAGFRSRVAAEVRALPPPAAVPRAIARHTSRSSLMALIAADEAWAMARPDGLDARRRGAVLGTTTGGMILGEENLRRTLLRESGHRPLTNWLETPASVAVDVVAHVFGCRGPRLTVSTACSSGANALGLAADWIRNGRADVVLCGGTDSLCRMTYSGFNALQALDRGPCRPFDRDRAGLTLGEGAAMFVFEGWEAARRRGVGILGEFVGYGVSADAHHLTQPRPDGAGAAAAMRRALAEAGVEAEEIDYVNAHGTGTPQNDAVETRAIKAVFGARAPRIPISSTKSLVGHCLGAAGAIEALAALLALREQFVPPTVNLEHPDPECDLDYVPKASRPASLRTVLSNSYGFGGNNTSLIVRAADD